MSILGCISWEQLDAFLCLINYAVGYGIFRVINIYLIDGLYRRFLYTSLHNIYKLILISQADI